MTETDQPEQDLRLEGDEALLAELLRGVPVTAAAEAAGYSEATARRRLREPTFRARLDEGRRELMTVVAAQLAGSSEVGYAVLRKIALDPEAPAPSRVRAAVELIAAAERVGEKVDLTADVLERLTRLERQGGRAPLRAAK